MTKRIIIQDYPATFHFDVRKDLPDFDDYCKVRQEILLRQFKKQNIDSPCHGYNEYVIEMVEPIFDGEIWILGS
jgi:hypothetical protein